MHHRRARTRRRRGAAAVEMALVLPLFLLLVFGTIESARLGMVAQLLNVAARDGCRTAVLPGATQAAVQARVQAVLAGSGIDVGTVSPQPSNWQSAAAGTPITVTLKVPFSKVSWMGDPLGWGKSDVTASATLSSERD